MEVEYYFFALLAGEWPSWLELLAAASILINCRILYTFREAVTFHFVKVFLKVVTATYFSRIEVIGLQNIPTFPAPVIFVANHNNQFVDGILLLSTCSRDVRFLVAAKSMKRMIVGHFSRALGAISVTRPQDLATKGQGKLSVRRGSEWVDGSGTNFASQVKPRDILVVEGGTEIPVASVESDTMLTLLKGDWDEEDLIDRPYKIIPKLDQKELYGEVFSALGRGCCLGIFPEGGSHDNTHLLPLKPGVALMGLGAMLEDQNMARVCIVPCGLNYFRGHRFRSKCVVEYGQPLFLSNTLVESFKSDKRSTTNELLVEVERRLRSVLPNAPDYDTLTMVMTARQLWMPPELELPAAQTNELNNQFLQGYERVKDDPEVDELMQEVRRYRKLLQKHGLRRAEEAETGGLALVFDLVRLIVVGVLALLPGIMLNAPVGLVARIVAAVEAKKAVAGSRVKIKGRDVMSSYKILVSMALMPMWYATWSVLIALYSGWPVWAVVAAILSMPLFSYLGVVFAEQGMIFGKRLWPTFMRVFSSSYRREHREVLQRAKALSIRVRAFVSKFAPRLAEEAAAMPVGGSSSSASLNMKHSESWNDLARLNSMLDRKEGTAHWPKGMRRVGSLKDLADIDDDI